MNETRAETFRRLRAVLTTKIDDGIPLPTIVSAVEFRREQYGLRSREWAALLGMAQPHYSEFTHGKKSLPRHAAAVAFRLGVPAEVLLQIDHPMVIPDIKVPDRYIDYVKTPDELREYNREAKRRSRERGKS